jgi:hypothetical protein
MLTLLPKVFGTRIVYVGSVSGTRIVYIGSVSTVVLTLNINAL